MLQKTRPLLTLSPVFNNNKKPYLFSRAINSWETSWQTAAVTSRHNNAFDQLFTEFKTR